MITKISRRQLIGLTFIVCHLSFSVSLTSCSDIFETDSDRQIFDPALDSKTDSMFYTLGILKGLQQAVDQYVMQGEMRGDLVQTNQYTETALRQLANFTADATNKYDSAYLFYRIINNCNYYIEHRDTTLRTGSYQVALPEYVEAYAVRAWAYMQLAKNYGTVPFYTKSLTSIGDANSVTDMRDLQGICDELHADLEKFSGTPVPNYDKAIEAGNLNSSGSKTISDPRRIMLPVDLVLGDLFLETHEYEKAAQYYFRYLNDNSCQLRQYSILPGTLSSIPVESMMTLPSNVSDELWRTIFTYDYSSEVITYIPMAANQSRGSVTELPRYFGYDFYNNTDDNNKNALYMVERQIDASPSYIKLGNEQDYYYQPSGQAEGSTEVRTSDVGDLRRHVTMEQVTKNDSLFYVMIKFNRANIPLYRAATVYLRLAEAINRMGYPRVAFAILKDGIRSDMLSTMPTYFLPEDTTFLLNKVPFLNEANVEKFTNNWGIHSRGSNYTQGAFSPYQMDSVVGVKLELLKEKFNLQRTEWTKADTINAVEDVICDEMALELAFEGNRFGDLTRMARHKNRDALYGSDFGSRWLNEKLAYKQPAVSLLDEKNWYLPFK